MSNETQNEKGSYIRRITQLDVNEFDQEISNVLYEQLMNINKYLKPGALDSIKHEINLIIKFLIFYYSVVKKNSTFGQQLLNLKYSTLLTKNQVVLYALLNYVLPYLKNKYEDYSSRIQSIEVRNAVKILDVLVNTFKFLNLMIFIRKGEYPTLIDRLLKLKYSSVGRVNPSVGYNYMTRELLWHGFTELLMNTLPFINYKALQRKVNRFIFSKASEIKRKRNTIYNSETKCVVCDDFPILPCQISTYCPHVACYYCLKSNLLADEKFMCPVCGESNTVNEQLIFLSG